MANNKMIIEERQREVGNFIVGRLLPFRKKRSVGPFVFIDHMGPTKFDSGSYVDIDQHPHIGLSTLTYLLEGEIEHRDSTGAFRIITPENVGFMTAGNGVTHSERTPQYIKDARSPNVMHGYQVWVALPKEKEQMNPRFDFYEKKSLPQWNENDLSITLIAGEAFGRTSPLTGYSHLFMADIHAEKDTELELKDRLKGEVAFVITKGSIEDDGETINAGEMLISKSNEECCISLNADTRVLIFGGAPLPEERFLLWNFVSSDKELLEKAKIRWEQGKFPKVLEDDSYIPFPT